MNITNGIVSIEDGTKAAEEYAPARKVRVELHFAIPEGTKDAEPMLTGVANMANAKVAELLGKTSVAGKIAKLAEAAQTALAETPAKPAKEPKALKEPKAPKDAAPKERTKADLEREAGLPVSSAGAQDETTTLDESDGKTTAAPAPKDEDDLGDLLGETAPKPITDLELGKAAQEKNSTEKQKQGDAWAPSKIRDLIAEFAGAGKRINDIPAAKRPEFMEKLKALK